MEENVYPDSVRDRLRRAFDDYEHDLVGLASNSLAGATHLVTSRKGLYAVNDREWSLIVPGFFFGLTFRDNEIFVFEACDLPHSPLRRGRVVRFLHRDGVITKADVVAKGLDSGCHQMDLCAGRLHVMDTYNQQVIRFEPGEASRTLISPLPTPPYGRWANTDRRYVHANSLLHVGETYLLLLHNGFEHTGRLSEIALYNNDWQPTGRWQLEGRSCHGLALLEDGTMLTCDSAAGDVITAQGMRLHVSPYMTRGLAVGADSIAVGASLRARREERSESSGTVTFLDRDFRIRTVLELPGAPTEVRRLDGEDSGLSSYLERVPWGQSLQPGIEIV